MYNIQNNMNKYTTCDAYNVIAPRRGIHVRKSVSRKCGEGVRRVEINARENRGKVGINA